MVASPPIRKEDDGRRVTLNNGRGAAEVPGSFLALLLAGQKIQNRCEIIERPDAPRPSGAVLILESHHAEAALQS